MPFPFPPDASKTSMNTEELPDSFSHHWQTGSRSLCWSGTLLMAIINLTPDSFSDGGRYSCPNETAFDVDKRAALQAAFQMKSDGADLFDLGGESTAPGTLPVPPEEQIRRVVPLVAEPSLQALGPVSVDTCSALVADKALSAGAVIVNDISGATFDKEMVNVVRRFVAGICIGHIQGRPKDMQSAPHYNNVVDDVFHWLKERRDILLQQGIRPEQIVVDPGIGFGKTFEQNWELLRHIDRLEELGHPVLVGHSRKRFLREFVQNNATRTPEGWMENLAKRLDTAPLPISRRFLSLDPIDLATAMVSALLVQKKVAILRVHYCPE